MLAGGWHDVSRREYVDLGTAAVWEEAVKEGGPRCAQNTLRYWNWGTADTIAGHNESFGCIYLTLTNTRGRPQRMDHL